MQTDHIIQSQLEFMQNEINAVCRQMLQNMQQNSSSNENDETDAKVYDQIRNEQSGAEPPPTPRRPLI